MNLEKFIANTFLEMAQGLETGSFGRRPKIALTGMGSEHGETNSIAAAKMAAERGVPTVASMSTTSALWRLPA